MAKHSDYFYVKRNAEIYTEHAEDIMRVITGHYQSLGLDFDYVPRDIIVRTDLNCPKFVLAANNPTLARDAIYLTCKRCSLWCKVVFQLGHELTHCYIYCHNPDESKFVNWIEETICEAAALYFLTYFNKNWSDVPLSEINPGYASAFVEYIADEIEYEKRDKLSTITTYRELVALDKTSQINRDERLYAVTVLWSKMVARDLKGLMSYRDFVKSGTILLDTVNIAKPFRRTSRSGIFASSKTVSFRRAVDIDDRIEEAVKTDTLIIYRSFFVRFGM